MSQARHVAGASGWEGGYVVATAEIVGWNIHVEFTIELVASGWVGGSVHQPSDQFASRGHFGSRMALRSSSPMLRGWTSAPWSPDQRRSRLAAPSSLWCWRWWFGAASASTLAFALAVGVPPRVRIAGPRSASRAVLSSPCRDGPNARGIPRPSHPRRSCGLGAAGPSARGRGCRRFS